MKGWLAFRAALEAALEEAAPDAETRLRAAIAAAPAAAQGIEIGVFPDRDGVGGVAILLSYQGADPFALNRGAEPFRTLFAGAQVSPRLPALSSALGPSEVGDMAVDLCAEWIASVWARIEAPRPPARVFGDGDRGKRTPLTLPRDG